MTPSTPRPSRVVKVVSETAPWLAVEEIGPLPEPGEGQVYVEMLLAAVHPANILQIRGQYGDQPALPYVPGFEGVGRVAACGPGVTRVQPGQMVLPLVQGTWADDMILSEKALMPVAEGTDPAQAALFKANPATALVMLTRMTSLEPGDAVIFNAANSSVGQNLIGICRALGLKSFAQVRSASAAEAIQGLNPDVLIIGDEIPAEATGAKLALDAIGGAATERLGGSLTEGGIVVTYGLLSGEAPRLAAKDVVFRGVTLRGFWLAQEFGRMAPADVRAIFAQLSDWLAKGVIGSRIAQILPLERAAELPDLHDAARDGKILLSTRHYC